MFDEYYKDTCAIRKSDMIAFLQENSVYSLKDGIGECEAILPCGIINVHGLFGEVTTYVVVEDKEQEIVSIEDVDHKKVQTVKGINILNIWLSLLSESTKQLV